LEKLTFEEAMAALEEIVDNLEKEQLSLNDSLAIFEKGISLSRICLAKLEEAEEKIHILLEQNGEMTIQPFHWGEEGE